ncbi:MAG: ribosome silencing factor [Lachnospiraceae bacterium]|jgi:ribosome-associated protein|nr:ribosome silencing factor [Lachnospiraceae bacterium]
MASDIESKKMCEVIVSALEEKLGENIQIIDISEISVIADYFILVTGKNESQIRALIDNTEEKMHRAGFEIKQREGSRNSNWILLDYGDVIVHVFDTEGRSFYNLERIWSDGKLITL